jgi:hypothetical protein
MSYNMQFEAASPVSIMGAMPVVVLGAILGASRGATMLQRLAVTHHRRSV